MSNYSSLGSSHMPSSHSERKLSKEKSKVLMLEKFAHRLDRRISLERQIIEKKHIFQELEKEIEQHEKESENMKQNIIRKRLQMIEEKRKNRYEKEKSTNKEVSKILGRDKKKQLILHKILEQNQSEYSQCYEKALKERKKLRKPINFEELENHEQKVLIKHSKSRKTSSLNNEELENGFQRRSHKMSRSVVEDYYEEKRRESERIEQIRETMRKRKDYGNRVEREYHSNRVKTQTKSQRHEEARRIEERKQILKKMKKPQLPFEVDMEADGRREIVRVRKSNLSAEEKLNKLNQLASIYQNKLKLKGKTEDLERVSEINLAKAEIMLGTNNQYLEQPSRNDNY